MPKQVKIDTVNATKERLSRAKAVVVTDYRGLTVQEMTDLRSRLRKENVEYKIIKNRLARIALKEAGVESLDTFLKGTTALAFGMKDPVGPAKVLTQYAKDNEKLKVLAGLMDNRVLGIPELTELAKMPSREVLLSRFIGSLSSPVQKMAFALHQTVAQLVYAFDAVARRKAEAGQGS